jgi:Cu(I)/Ag(I) efflux system membrane fusion protein
MSLSESRSASVWLAVGVLIVRLRFFLVLAVVLLLVGYWHTVRRYWERTTGSRTAEARTLASDAEFWCPMCPGVVSDFPGKCPVCNMALVVRKKGEAVPLPDGVLARMQFSLYRVQLAGIRTAVVEARPLRREVVMVGPVERSAFASAVVVRAEVFADDLPYLSEGQTVEASVEALSGHPPFRGRIARIDEEGGTARRAVVRLELDDPDRDLRSGALVTVRAEAPITRLRWWRRAVSEEWRSETVVDVMLHSLLTPAIPTIPAGVRSLLSQAGTQALLAEGYGLAVPCSAVIDRGARKVAFIENGPGMFDAVEIEVGPRCGDYYPVLRGVDAEQRVAATGAFLLDAETWLNRGLASTYFGATRNAGTTTAAPPPTTTDSLPAEERSLVAKQKICPVTGEALDSMGGPVRVEVAGRIVFVCCKGCIEPLRKDPAKYLSKLPAK